MRGLSPFLNKWLQGQFEKDCSVIRANEFFVSQAYNSLVESLYDLLSKGSAAREVFNPSTPGVSGRIHTLNSSGNTGLGYDHYAGDTFLLLEKINTDYNSHIKVRHTDRTYDVTSEYENPTYNNPSPVYVSYGFGDISMSNPYAFIALDVSEGNEQYMSVEFIRDAECRRYASAVQLILEYIPDNSFSDCVELVKGDRFDETTSEGSSTRYTRYLLRFGQDITATQLRDILNLYAEDGNPVFQAVVHGGVSPDLIKIRDMFYFYDGTDLVSSSKVLRFVPPIPSVKILNPADFFNKYFNLTTTAPHNMNILAYTSDGGNIPDTFINTGIYGFVLRKNYDDAGYQTYPTVVTYEGNPALMYIPNKKADEHYTLPGTGTPSWFVNGNPVLDGNHISSVDLDGNYYFLPFVEVTDCTVRFLSGKTVGIESIEYNDVVNVSETGSYSNKMLASRVRFDANDYTLEELEVLENIFDQIKMYLGYAAADDFDDQESTLLRVSEFTSGILWYLNRIVMIDGALSEDLPELNMFISLESAAASGILSRDKTVIIITGRAAPADRTEPVDRARFNPLTIPEMPGGMRFMVLEPSAACAGRLVNDPEFTLAGASRGSVVLYLDTIPGPGVSILTDQDFYESGMVTICAKSTLIALNIAVSGCRFRMLKFYKDNADPDNTDVWWTALRINRTNSIDTLQIDGQAGMPFSKTDPGYTDYPVELTGDKAVFEVVVGAAPLDDSCDGTGIDYICLPEGSGEYLADSYDHPGVLGLTLYPEFIRDCYAAVPSMRIMGGNRGLRTCNIEFRPIYQCFQLNPSAEMDYSSLGYADHITRFDAAYGNELNMVLKYRFTEYSTGNFQGEQRIRASFPALISIYGEIRRSDICIEILDVAYYHDTYGDWHSFDPDVFLASTSVNPFSNKFMFIDGGVSIQMQYTTVSGGFGPITVPVENRGGRFIDTDLTVKFLNGCVLDSYYSLRFMASRLFRKAPYIFYFADMHPYYSRPTLFRKVSENLNLRIECPGVYHPEASDVELAFKASIAVKSNWYTNFSSVGDSYPLVDDVTYSGYTGNSPLNWIGCKSVIAGMSHGSIKIDDLRMPPVQKQLNNPLFPAVEYPNSGLAFGEDLSKVKIAIGKLDTLYPLNGVEDEGLSPGLLSIWKESERGFQLLTVSQIDTPELNAGTEITIGGWWNRASVTGITGGRKIKADIPYRFYTQASDSYISDIGNLVYKDDGMGNIENVLPAKPWFVTAGVQDSDISFTHSAGNDATGITLPGGGTLRAVLAAFKGAATTPNFYPAVEYGSSSADTADRLRPVRFVLGSIIKHREKSDGSQTSYLMSANDNRCNVCATRVNLIFGAYNRCTGLIYMPSTLIAAQVMRSLAPDSLYYSTDLAHVFHDEFLDYLNTENILATLAFDYSTETSSATAATIPTASTAFPLKHERQELFQDILGVLNPCDLKVVNIVRNAGGGTLDLIISVARSTSYHDSITS